MKSEHFCHIDVEQNTPSKIEIRLDVKMSENVLDAFVSGVKKCQKIDPCVKMSENFQRFKLFRSIF